MALMLFEPKVHLIEETHQYFHNESGEQYTSVSRVLDILKQPFDKEARALSTANKRGISVEEVLKEWDWKRDNASNHGTDVHKSLEIYKEIGKLPEDRKHHRALVQAVMKIYSDYYRVFSEVIIYNDKYKVAGTADQPMLISSHKNSAIDIDDFKTNVEKGIQYYSPYGNYCQPPFDYWPDCNFIHYAMQLSIYGYMIQELTGRKIRSLNILYIPANDPLNFKRIPVPYLKKEAIELLELFRMFHQEKKENHGKPDEPDFG